MPGIAFVIGLMRTEQTSAGSELGILIDFSIIILVTLDRLDLSRMCPRAK